MSKVKEETKFLLTYKFRAYPSALLEYRMENWLYVLTISTTMPLRKEKEHGKRKRKALHT